jgi:hypothetical protein
LNNSRYYPRLIGKTAMALILGVRVHTLAAGDDPGKAIHEAVAQYKLPPLDMQATYTAEALQDFTEYHRALGKLTNRFYNMNGIKRYVENEYKEGSVLARTTMQYEGDGKRYFLNLAPVDFSPWMNVTAYYDGKKYLVQTNPGSRYEHTSVASTYTPFVSPYYELLDTVPYNVPDTPKRIITDGSHTLKDFLDEALKSENCKISGDAHELTVSSTINPNQIGAEIYLDQVEITLKLLPVFELESITSTRVKMGGDKGVIFYGTTVIEYSGYKEVAGCNIPSKIIFTHNSSLADFGGKPNATIANVLGITEGEVTGRYYKVIRHIYSLDSAKPADTSKAGFDVKAGEQILNLDTNTRTVAPKTARITDVGAWQ